MPEEIQNGQEEEVLQEQPQTEEQVEELSTSEDPTEEVQEETQEPELPEDTKERTRKEFEKLKANNAELKRQLEERQQMPSVLDYPGFEVPQVSPEVGNQYMQPVAMPGYNFQQPQEQKPEAQLVDEQGYVNAELLKQQLKQAEQASRRAEEAERRAMEAQSRIAKFEQTAEEKALYQEYPELDPLSESFNREAYDLVKNELTSQIINTGKRNAITAAQKMSKYFRSQQPTNQKVIEQRKQVATVSGNQPRQMGTDLEELKLRSRKDPNAVAERLRRLGM
jgi:hypothetical protein